MTRTWMAALVATALTTGVLASCTNGGSADTTVTTSRVLDAQVARPAATAPQPAPASPGTATAIPNGIAAQAPFELQVGGKAGVPANAAAVVMNVTVTNPSAAGFVTVWPCGQPMPNASNLNYARGQTIPNLTITKLGTGGKVCFNSFAPTDLIADVAGYFPAGSSYVPANPTRILDTRSHLAANRQPANAQLQLQVAGLAGVPANAAAVVMNVTVTNPSAPGFVTVWPCGQPKPNASNLNYGTGQTIPNLTITKLGTAGKVCLSSFAPTDLIADVAGYFPAGSDYVSANPARILDTRNHLAANRQPAHTQLQLQVGGVAGVPANAAAVVMNMTVTNPSGPGFVTVWPCGQTMPNASNLNYGTGQTIPNLTITKLGTGGKVCSSSFAPTDLIADVAGYFPAGSSYVSANPTRILDTRNGTGTPTGSGGCTLSKADVPVHVAFCEDFSVAHPTPATKARTGDLDPIVWGVSRIATGPAGQLDEWAPATLVGCGSPQTVLPPADVRVCNGRLFTASADSHGQTELAVYPKQPFDFANRTGTVAFDVSADSEGPHAAWPEFWITDQPLPAPKGHLTTQAPYARNSLGLVFATDSGNCPEGQSGVREIDVTRNYQFAMLPFTSVACVNKGSATGALNHIEVRVNQSRVEVWGSDPGSTATRLLAYADNAALSFTRGVVWLEDVHYNACKLSGNDQCDHTFGWDNLGFDGPAPYRDLTFDVPDNRIALAGGMIDMGYDATASGLTLPVQGVFWNQTPTSALVMFNWFATSQSIPSVQVNGNPVHTMAWPFDSETYSWRTIAIPVPVAEVVQGTNSVTIRSGNTVTVANVNIALIAATPVPG